MPDDDWLGVRQPERETLLEETARHAGHLDLMREQIDGRTGD